MTRNSNGAFRRKRVNFAQVSNCALHDANLSLKAKGLYSLIQSLITLPDEDLRIWKIQKKCKEGDKAFEAAWKELKDCGYLKQYRMPGSKCGQFDYVYDLLDQPDLSTPAVINLNKFGEPVRLKENSEGVESDHTPQKGVHGKSDAAEPVGNDSDHYPPKGGDGENWGIEPDHTPLFAPDGKSTECLKHPVDNGGDNSNTLSRNIIPRNIKSVYLTDDRTDEIRESLKVQAEYDYFEENRPEDLPVIDAVIEYMTEMLANNSTKINGAVQSSEALSRYISQMDACALQEFLSSMKDKSFKNVKNKAAYWRSSIINFLRERAAELVTA